MSKRLFKTMVAVLAIAAAATGPVRAQSTTESFTITFKTTGSESDGSSPQTTIAGIIANGADYVSEVNATKVYQAKDGYGIKLGSNSATGSLTLTLANAVENVTSIVVNARQYGDGTSERTLQIQGDNYTTTDAFADYTYTYTTPATVSTITLATTTKRAYIKSVTVNYTTSTGGGGSTPEPPAPAVPHTVRMAEGTEDAANWSIASGNASVPGNQVLENVMSGSQVTATYNGTTKKVKSVKAVKYVAPEVITWNSTNVFNNSHQNDKLNPPSREPLTYEGITISLSGNDVSSFYPYSTAMESPALTCYGDDGDSFTFTAPAGKKFTKIEIINNGYMNFDAYGDWTRAADNKIVWRGTAASTVTLGTVFTLAGQLNSIVFTLIDAQ